jgi:hypothetical protein
MTKRIAVALAVPLFLAPEPAEEHTYRSYAYGVVRCSVWAEARAERGRRSMPQATGWPSPPTTRGTPRTAMSPAELFAWLDEYCVGNPTVLLSNAADNLITHLTEERHAGGQ